MTRSCITRLFVAVFHPFVFAAAMVLISADAIAFQSQPARETAAKPANPARRATTPTAPDPRAPFLEGVKTIAAPGVPGSLALWGEQAFIVVLARDNSQQVPVVAASEMGSGRIVLFGHTGYLDAEALSQGDTAKLLSNAIHWAAGDRPNPRIGLIGSPAAAEALAKAGIPATAQRPGWPERLDTVDVLLTSRTLRDEDIPAVQKFIDGGGGFVTAQCGWGWRQLSGDKDMVDFSINRIVAPAGLAFTDGYTERTANDGFDATTAPQKFIHGGAALDAILASAAPTANRPAILKLTDDDMALAADSAMRALRILPADESRYRPQVDRLLSQRGSRLLPAERTPLTARSAPIDRFLLAYQIDQIKRLGPDQVKAHPASAVFPGAVPVTAKRITKTLPIDTRIPQWHSLGLYAPPGAILTVTVPEGVEKSRLSIVIGCHTDELWHHDEWKRVPEISRRFPVDAAWMQVASAFGGLMYLDIPEGCTLGDIEVTITGAVESPLFVLDKTTPDEWKAARLAPGPWAELASGKVIVSVPSERIRGLDDPAAVMKFWDRVLDADADLAGIPRERKRPERFAADVQISAGYMHSGYPIMTHLDAGEWLVGLDDLRKGNWGLYHEMGHNHQDDAWTFDGTGEVTCNLFTLYVHDTVCDIPQTTSTRWLTEHRRELIKHLDRGASFDRWKGEPFTALVMYIQLQQAFGWETYKKVFAEYRTLAREDRPRTDDQKRDQWMVRFSNACGRNLGPFFQAWGVPTSQHARDQIASLPAWMPDDWPTP